MSKILLRAAVLEDAADIARILRAALSSFAWMPTLHTPQEDLAFAAGTLLPEHAVTVAEAGGILAGFIAVQDDRVEQLYLDPRRTGLGIGSRLLTVATVQMPVVRLHCFQANLGARRFYERHGFVAEAFGDGSSNEEGLPDILYVRRKQR